MMAVVHFTEGVGSKRRPVVVVQADRFNGALFDTIVASVTSNVGLAGPPNRFLIDPSTDEGSRTGLKFPSVVRCDRLFTIARSTLGKKLGQLSAADLSHIDSCLKSALDLS
jgi:mRNA-degrading endonuclease toxin of MazEF toxin-antitoxin module